MTVPLKEWLWDVLLFNILILIDFQRFCPVFVEFYRDYRRLFFKEPLNGMAILEKYVL